MGEVAGRIRGRREELISRIRTMKAITTKMRNVDRIMVMESSAPLPKATRTTAS